VLGLALAGPEFHPLLLDPTGEKLDNGHGGPLRGDVTAV
jgi:hypothetical protein